MTIDLVKDFCHQQPMGILEQLNRNMDMWRKLHIWYTNILIRYSGATFPNDKNEWQWFSDFFIKCRTEEQTFFIAFNNAIIKYIDLVKATPNLSNDVKTLCDHIAEACLYI